MRKRGASRCFACMIFLCLLLGRSVPAEETVPEELNQLYARSAVLMDGESGRILYGKKEQEVLPMASTTKIMTCILALELAGEEEICEVTQEAASQPKVHLGMQAGETYYLKDLLYSMMLESHNDSAVCVAEHIGGSVEGFAKLMNQKAAEIGCSRTHYVTPNGLDGEDVQGAHSTTAADLARVMRYCIRLSGKREEFLRITETASYSFTDVSGKRSFSCTNHNALLTMVDGALSGKTGFTGKAGYCYVGAVQQDGKLLIGALLACGWPNNKGYKWADMRRLLEYGFGHYEKRSIDPGKIELRGVSVRQGIREEAGVSLGEQGRAAPKAFWLLVREDEKLTARVELPEAVQAPVAAGTEAGMMRIFAGEEKVAEYPLVYSEEVGRFDWEYCLEQVFGRFCDLSENG